jgi:hypothetical protein
MTEVPDKLTEGRVSVAVVAAAAVDRATRNRRHRSRTRPGSFGRAGPEPVSRPPRPAPGIVALPGERLSRAGGLTEADLARAEVFTLDEGGEEVPPATGELGGP